MSSYSFPPCFPPLASLPLFTSYSTPPQVGEIKDAHAHSVTSVELFHDQLVLSNSSSGELALTDLRSYKVLHRYRGSDADPYLNRKEKARACFSPDYRYIVAGDDLGRLFVWNVNTTQLVSIIKPPVSTTKANPAVYVEWSPNGRQISSVDVQGCLSIWEDPVVPAGGT